MNLIIIVVGAVAILIVIGLLILVFQRSNKVELTPPSDIKPEWMRDMPPAETTAKTLADGEGVTVFDYEHGERLAAPFAEQIEDIVRAKLQANPELQEYKIDFGTDKDHTLEIWVNEKKYKNISELPDERLKQAMREAIQQFQK
jgi:hypothetical protein